MVGLDDGHDEQPGSGAASEGEEDSEVEEGAIEASARNLERFKKHRVLLGLDDGGMIDSLRLLCSEDRGMVCSRNIG